MFYSASTCGFYSREIHGDNMPADVVEITNEEYESLLSGQSSGKLIKPDAQGRPVLQDPPVPPAADIAEVIDAQREAAYRLESDPIFFKYQRGEATKDQWIASVEAVKARYPK